MAPPFVWQDEGIFNGSGEPLDAGWRVLLSAILRKVDDKEERIRALDAFFRGYVEYLNK
jgi:hypothetical protein